ncbi:MAG: phosphoribosylanthranilate isomerase [Deltaproteobacteria bacterium]
MYVKVCGITHLDDAWSAIAAGADVLGFNFVPESKRRIGVELARSIIEQIRGQALAVAVVANLPTREALELLSALGADRLQLHGDESQDQLLALLPRAFKALRVGGAEDVSIALSFPGQPLLVDAKVEGQLGGTGRTVDWPLVAPIARQRPLILAGGLTPDNVEQAVRIVRPWGVDTASGVEVSTDPRRKDPEKLRSFVAAARRASPGQQAPAF